jgi:hypothetical protein
VHGPAAVGRLLRKAFPRETTEAFLDEHGFGGGYTVVKDHVRLCRAQGRETLVRYRTNDYSVPTAYGFQDVVVKGFVDEVVILCGGEEIARHARSYGTGVFVADPLHYLALIEMKRGALDQAAALQGWELPQVFQHLRHLLEARMGNRGKREFIQVLRLLEAMPKDVVTFAVTEAIRRARAWRLGSRQPIGVRASHSQSRSSTGLPLLLMMGPALPSGLASSAMRPRSIKA